MPADARKTRRKARRQRARARAEGMLQGVLAMLRPGDVVFDCGANVGDVTAQLVATGAQVHAFEPDPVAYAKLTERFGERENLNLYNVAVATENGIAHLRRAADFRADPEARTTRSSILSGGKKMNDGALLQIEAISLPEVIRDVVREHGEIAFVKLDIEGAELAILEAMDSEGLFEHVRLTVAETHEGKFPALRESYKALRARIAAAYPITKVNLEWM